jgi:endophilin-B
MAESSYDGGQEAKGRGHSFNESLGEKLGEFRKFASTSFTRAKQYTIEKIGKAENVTTYDTEYETLSQQLESIRTSTEKIISHVQTLVQPHPGVRLEENIYTRLEKTKPHRSETEELLGAEMGKASSAFGDDTSEYGAYLRQCGSVEVKMGQALLVYHSRVQKEFLTPLKAFLEVDVKNVMRERKALGVKRLDLDAAKSRTRKLTGEKLMQAEMELRETQADFDMQLNKVREGTKKVIQIHTHYLGYLKSFMAAQKEYHRECLTQLETIDTEGVV